MAAPAQPGGRGGFLSGVMLGFMLAGLAVGFMAAGSRSQNPANVIAALAERGVAVDPRIARLPPAVRRSLLCVAMAVFMEARGEPALGQAAVAWVTRTRSAERDLTPCDTVFELNQYTWTSYPIRRIVAAIAASPDGFLETQDVAWRVMVDAEPDPTFGANHFWGHRAMPRPPTWARMAVSGSRRVIGGHTFIRIPPRRSPWAFVAPAARPVP